MTNSAAVVETKEALPEPEIGMGELHPMPPRDGDEHAGSPGNLVAVLRKAEMSFSGPLPHPKHFKDYGEVEPSAPGRILAMAEKEQEFQHRMAEKALGADVWSHTKTMVMGWLLIATLIGLAGYALVQGNNWGAALFLGATGITGIIGKFVDFSWRKKPEEAEAAAQVPAKRPTKPASPKRSRRR